MTVDLEKYHPDQRVRFLNRETGEVLTYEGVITVIDTETGSYRALKVKNGKVAWRKGRAVEVKGTFSVPVVIDTSF